MAIKSSSRSARPPWACNEADPGIQLNPVCVCHCCHAKRWLLLCLLQVLRDFWRDVQELCGEQLLDDSFFKQNNMAGRAREYRLLAEPTEIANYYHGNMHLPNTRGQGGHYIDGITLELSDDNSRRPGRLIFLQQVEQRVFAERDPAYTTASSLGRARLLKELVGSRTWKEYKEQPEGPQQQDTLQQHTTCTAGGHKKPRL